MKLIRLYSFRRPTAKFPRLEYKSTLSPSSQVFATGLLLSPSSLLLFPSRNDRNDFRSKKVNLG